MEPKDRREFENGLQARIRHEVRGVVSACGRMPQYGATFRGLLIDQATKFLERRIPYMAASAALFVQSPGPSALSERLRELVASAAPVTLGHDSIPRPTVALLGMPEDDASDRLASVLRVSCPEHAFRPVTTAEDVYFILECQGVPPAALPHLSNSAPAAETADAEPPTAHARADVSWVPAGAE
jgi:hypothetical protein